MSTFFIVAGTILISSLITATFLVAGIEYLYEKITRRRK